MFAELAGGDIIDDICACLNCSLRYGGAVCVDTDGEIWGGSPDAVFAIPGSG